MSFLIKSDTVCPWSIDLKTLVKGRFDVVVDFVIESTNGGVREVYVMLCDGTTHYVNSPTPPRAREAAEWLLSTPVFKTSLETLLKKYRHVYYLHEGGIDVSRVKLERGLYVFGDHDGLSPRDEEVLSKRAVWISLGRTPYMSWQAAVYMAYLLRKLGV